MIASIHPLSITLYGPFTIQGYGIALVCSLVVTSWLMFRHLKRVIPITFDTFSSIICQSILVGIVGGRLLHVITERHLYTNLIDVLAVWHGGLSILGAVLAVCAYIVYALRQRAIPLFPALDIAALYLPLAHAGGRLGCLSAGCCSGLPTSWPWAIMYHGTTSGAPVGISLHPTQIYSTLCFLILFALLYFLYARTTVIKRPGTLILLYLLGGAAERFSLDFLRDDRIMGPATLLSFHQWLALGVGVVACILLACVGRVSKRGRSSSA